MPCFGGAVPLMMEAVDKVVADRARRLWVRDLLKCVDVRRQLEERYPPEPEADSAGRAHRNALIRSSCDSIIADVRAWAAKRPEDSTPVLIDQARRQPYKKFDDSR